MIRIRWSPAAAQDLEEICQHLREHHPSFVHSTVRKIYEAGRSLKQFPNRGRIGSKTGTRELLALPLPYLIVYGVTPEVIHIFE